MPESFNTTTLKTFLPNTIVFEKRVERSFYQTPTCVSIYLILTSKTTLIAKQIKEAILLASFLASSKTGRQYKVLLIIILYRDSNPHSHF